jgi:RNA polymerase sigma-70 factor, ECF subfamily
MQIDQAISNVIPFDFRGSSKQPSDIALVGSIARHNKGAMQALFCRYKLPVYRFALRFTRSQETAEDIVSEVFLEVWRHAGRFEARSQVSTWLLAIARNLAFSAMRQRATEELSETMKQELADNAETPEAATAKNQQTAILAQCLNKLSSAHREVVDLVYYHDKSVSEVAEIIGIPPATVKTRMHYARKELADLLERHRGSNAGRTAQFGRQWENLHKRGPSRSRPS